MVALLTQSRLASSRTCQRLHHLKYELGYRAIVELGGRKFGTLVHAGLEAFWRARMTGASNDEALAVALAAMQGERDPYERVKAEVLLTAYATRWSGDRYKVLGVETQFSTELRNPATGAASRTWQLAGKLDVILFEIDTDRIVFMEHKTSAEDITPGATYWRRLRMDTQVSVYFEGASSLGYAAEACIYDVIGKPDIRPKGVPILDDDGLKVVLNANGERVRTKTGKWRETSDSELGYALQTRLEMPDEYRARLIEAVAAEPDRYLQRGEVVRLAGEMTDALTDIWDTAKQIQEAKIAGRNPRNPGACMQWGRTCDFFEHCSGAAALDDPTLFTRSADVHPELDAQPTAGSKEEIQS